MGTSTIFRRLNDLHCPLAEMSKEELEGLDNLSPWGEEKESVRGWSAMMELHNGNSHLLVWWHGRLFHLRDAPALLAEKHYNKHTGKYSQASEWALLKRHLEMELKRLDKEYKRLRRRRLKDTQLNPAKLLKSTSR